MNTSGDPDRDDPGLPPVDIRIPDDARELDRDVLAYHRELRALRRRLLWQRLAAPLTRHGLLMPLIASCLALTLLAGTLLTVFSAGQAAWPPGQVPQRTALGGQRGRVGQPLPDSIILVEGVETPLGSLPPAVLAVIPARCRCEAALRQLASQAAAAQAYLYLVGMKGVHVAGLIQQPGLRAAHPAEDPGNVLASYYRLSGLTAILVRPDGRVAAIIPAHGGRLPLGSALRAVVSG
ncbi:MAG: hypothetical protein J2P34_07200 [Actinobacteria bacterium]|nr:hypothetical protein [Actinomycetota bacterium]